MVTLLNKIMNLVLLL